MFLWWDEKRKADQAILCNNIIIWYSYHVSSYYIVCDVFLQAHDFEHAYEALEKVLRVRGFDLIWLRVGNELWGGWKICIQSSVSNEFAWFLQYMVQIRRAMLGLPDARYIFSRNAAVLFEALDISGSTFAKAGAEPDRVNDDSNCAALLAAAVNDSTDVGCPRKRVEPW